MQEPPTPPPPPPHTHIHKLRPKVRLGFDQLCSNNYFMLRALLITPAYAYLHNNRLMRQPLLRKKERKGLVKRVVLMHPAGM